MSTVRDYLLQKKGQTINHTYLLDMWYRMWQCRWTLYMPVYFYYPPRKYFKIDFTHKKKKGAQTCPKSFSLMACDSFWIVNFNRICYFSIFIHHVMRSSLIDCEVMFNKFNILIHVCFIDDFCKYGIVCENFALALVVCSYKSNLKFRIINTRWQWLDWHMIWTS